MKEVANDYQLVLSPGIEDDYEVVDVDCLQTGFLWQSSMSDEGVLPHTLTLTTTLAAEEPRELIPSNASPRESTNVGNFIQRADPAVFSVEYFKMLLDLRRFEVETKLKQNELDVRERAKLRESQERERATVGDRRSKEELLRDHHSGCIYFPVW